jgi:hypothetical protein
MMGPLGDLLEDLHITVGTGVKIATAHLDMELRVAQRQQFF